MTKFRTLLIAITAVGLATSSALANEADRIWDAFSQQGNTILKAKYKESPENGLIEQQVEVEVQNGPRNAEMTITLLGKNVATVTTDGFGDFRGQRRRVVIGSCEGRPCRQINDGDEVCAIGGGLDICATFIERP